MDWDDAIEDAKRKLGYSSGYIEDWDEVVSLAKYYLAEERRREKEEYREDYHHYIKYSPNWKYLRLKILQRDKFKCKDCGGKATQVHHESYENINFDEEEEMFDCVSLCSICHKLRHNLLTKANILQELSNHYKFVSMPALNEIHKHNLLRRVLLLKDCLIDEKIVAKIQIERENMLDRIFKTK